MFLKVAPNSKAPVKGPLQKSEDAAEFFSQGFNVGLLLEDLTVVDFDDKPKARKEKGE